MGSFPFARHYSGNRCFFLFLRVLRCFNSPGSLCITMDSSCNDCGLHSRVSPFGYLRIDGYLRLPEAFRSLSRPSSAPSTKASTLYSYQLDRLFVSVSSSISGRQLRVKIYQCILNVSVPFTFGFCFFLYSFMRCLHYFYTLY